jgi:uncharacterized protein
MHGINATTGKALEGKAHIRQSIRDILSTPLGSRIMRRDYGSRLFELVDKPTNQSTVADIYAAVVDALGKWESRVTVDSVALKSVGAGSITLSLSCIDNETGESLSLANINVAS